MHSELGDSASVNAAFLPQIPVRGGCSSHALDLSRKEDCEDEGRPTVRRFRAESYLDLISERLRRKSQALRRSWVLTTPTDPRLSGGRDCERNVNADLSNERLTLPMRFDNMRRRQQQQLVNSRIEEERATRISDERGKLSDQSKDALVAKFRLVCRLIVICHRLCEEQKLENQDYDHLFPYLRTIHYQEYDDVGNTSDDVIKNGRRIMIFNPKLFKSSRESPLTNEARRILSKPQNERTNSELVYAKAALMSIKTYSEYPVKMQEQIVQIGFYERFESKRLILRQGHRPSSFYFIFSGSVVVMVRGEDSLQSFPICYRQRGDTFGEQVINANSFRLGSVVSKNTVELIRIDVEHIRTVFMTGDLKNLLDSNHLEFLRNLELLRGWPIEKIIDISDTRMAVSMYFRRGEVLVTDSKSLDSLIIVKSGSVRVLMKVTSANGGQTPKVTEKSDLRSMRRELDSLLPSGEQTSGEGERTAAANQLEYFLLSEVSIRIPLQTQSRDDEDGRTKLPEIRKSSFGRTQGQQETGSRTLGDGSGDSLGVGDDSIRCKLPKIERLDNATKHEETNSTRRFERRSEEDRAKEQDARQKENQSGTNITEDTDHGLDIKNDFCTRADDCYQEYIQVQTLTTGQAFGLANLIHDDQPTMCVVSEGAECILLNRNFFLQNAPEKLIAALKINCPQYPTEDEIQAKFQRSIDWHQIKGKILSKAMDNILSTRNNRPSQQLKPLHVQQLN